MVLHVRGEDEPVSTAQPAAPSTSPSFARPGAPVRLVIPRIGLRSPVVRIASRDRALTPPADPSVVGWWAGGVRPGSPAGSAILTAHTVRRGGGAFDQLPALEPGDRLVVVSARRGRLRYAVHSSVTLGKDAFARESARLLRQTGPGRVVLVTCSGWDGTAWRSNTVVVARPLRG